MTMDMDILRLYFVVLQEFLSLTNVEESAFISVVSNYPIVL